MSCSHAWLEYVSIQLRISRVPCSSSTYKRPASNLTLTQKPVHVSVSKGGRGWREYSQPGCFPVKSASHPRCHRTCQMLACYVSDTDTKEEGTMTWSFQNRWGIRVTKGQKTKSLCNAFTVENSYFRVSLEIWALRKKEDIVQVQKFSYSQPCVL